MLFAGSPAACWPTSIGSSHLARKLGFQTGFYVLPYKGVVTPIDEMRVGASDQPIRIAK